MMSCQPRIPRISSPTCASVSVISNSYTYIDSAQKFSYFTSNHVPVLFSLLSVVPDQRVRPVEQFPDDNNIGMLISHYGQQTNDKRTYKPELFLKKTVARLSE